MFNYQRVSTVPIKHGNGRSPMTGDVDRKIIYVFGLFSVAMFDYRKIATGVRNK